MKIRHTGTRSDEKIDINMTPMIDAVFQLLIFFMLTLKILEQEGNFDINMPVSGVPGEAVQDLAIKVFLQSNPDGTLAQIRLGGKPLGNDVPLCYRRLNGPLTDVTWAVFNRFILTNSIPTSFLTVRISAWKKMLKKNSLESSHSKIL